MTLDEAIKHCLEVAEKNAGEAEVYNLLAKNHNNPYEKLTASRFHADCAECATNYRQLAEWLTDYKELKNSIGAVKLSDIKEALELIQDYKADYIEQKKLIAEYKRLLKSAIDEWHIVCEWGDCSERCDWFENGKCTQEWRYKAEALKLIES